jgi:hypothetical protein
VAVVLVVNYMLLAYTCLYQIQGGYLSLIHSQVNIVGYHFT